MLGIKHSISRKFMTTFTVVIILSSLLFSISFYFVSMGIINKNVLPQFDKVLHTSTQDIYRNLNTTMSLQLLNGGENSRFGVEAYLTKSVEDFQLHTVYLVHLQDEQATVIATSSGSTLETSDTIAIQDAMRQASAGKIAISELYQDQFGYHKTAYLQVPGSDLLLAVGIDATFIKEKQTEILWICLGITAVIIFLGITAAYMVSKRITKPIRNLAQVTEKMAHGDFRQTIEVQGHDELAQLAASFRTMTEQLKGMITNVLHTSQTVVNTSDNLLASAQTFEQLIYSSNEATQQVEAGSSTIATTAAENARAMEEISAGIHHIASSSAEITEKIGEASDKAISGNQIVHDAVTEMLQVEEAAMESMNHISLMNERSAAIAQIVGTIMEISKQINILALNAAIESARAGEHGRGFAVVAEEIRKLAEQSRIATDEIGDYLLAIQDEASNSVRAMQRVSDEIQSGTSRVKSAEEAFSQLAAWIQNINLTVQSISSSTQQVSASAEEVTASVEEAANITAKSLVTIEEIAHNSAKQADEINDHANAVRNLHEGALSLRESVRQFII
ncbi:methyl-accepting chemotaxis protein [Paenibacillus lentus]|uniref:Methyl-accepting chemotaxis protein n=1 Tax=Paenibacillus lentus TaxID=1338368 RepID=A0A3Q8S6D9_9BACL|nr:HAMP domain-containing methyl-accepting chemotaxis protein [Paenibacillus lentus]AZK48275.1 methyl-accepting chemotaxis protein [Paenibacillus lentus]